MRASVGYLFHVREPGVIHAGSSLASDVNNRVVVVSGVQLSRRVSLYEVHGARSTRPQ